MRGHRHPAFRWRGVMSGSDLEARFGAGNYAPLPVSIVRGDGVYLWDDQGRRYIDMMGAYSAVSFGHCHPRLVETLVAQAQRLDTIPRAYFNDLLRAVLALPLRVAAY